MASTNNPIGKLQELHQQDYQKNGVLGIPPTYNLIESGGAAHAPFFKIEATFREQSAVGEGSSKKQAKTLAAARLLSKVEELKADQLPVAEQAKSSLGNKVGELMEYCSGKGLIFPWYEEVAIEGPAHMRTFTIRCELKDVFKETAYASTKKSAKRDAANLVLEKLKVATEAQLAELKDTTRNKKAVQPMKAEPEVNEKGDGGAVKEDQEEGAKEEKGDGAMGVWVEGY